MENGFYKVGAECRKDQLLKIGEKNWLLIIGYYEDEVTGGYNWRKNYKHKPTIGEMRVDVDELMNCITERRILSGYVWMGKRVWLSQENQFNFKAAYDLAVQSGGANLPVTFKLGEDGFGNALYHTFDVLGDLQDFYVGCVNHVLDCINEGWKEKDSVDYSVLLSDV